MPQADGGVEYRSREVRTEERPTIALLAPRLSREQPLLRMCSWCKRVNVESDSSRESDNARRGGGLRQRQHSRHHSHIYGDCRHLLLQED